MPGRSTAILIILFWLAAISWQVARTLTAPYTSAPKLLNSLRLAAEDGETHWTISHNGQPVGTTITEVREDRAIGFILRQEVSLDQNLGSFLRQGLIGQVMPLGMAENLALTMSVDMQVTQFGSLHRFTLAAAVHLDKKRRDGTLRAFFSGRTEEGFLQLSGNVSVQGQKFPLPSDTKMRYDNKNQFISSLAPADCLPGLRPGQTWEAPVIDISDLLATPALSAAGEFGMPARKPAQVRVRDEMVTLEWQGQSVACFLVESKQRGLTIQLWVRAEDGRVLKQQARWGESSIEMVRGQSFPRAVLPRRSPPIEDEDTP